MKLTSEFIKLPLTFDADRLLEEVNRLQESEWLPHPSGYAGNMSVPLISVHGGRNDEFVGAMEATPALKKCPYIQQVLAVFDSVLGRSRLMRLDGQSEVPTHCDVNYHWYTRVRVHIPIVTNSDVRFICNDREVNMAQGEAWVFDNWKLHRVVNSKDVTRIHLVVDTTGSSRFWELVSKGEAPFGESTGKPCEARFIPYQKGKSARIQTEKHTVPSVMSPAEVDLLALDLLADLKAANVSNLDAERFAQAVNEFRLDWRQAWHLYAEEPAGLDVYNRLCAQLGARVSAIPTKLLLASNGTLASGVLNNRILAYLHNQPPATNDSVAATKRPGATAAERKVGRNEPCPCGSGKKYKRCHG